MTADPGLVQFNQLTDLRAQLRACCASAVWVERVAAGGPYAARSALLDRSASILAALDWARVREAVDAHPRIGQRARGDGLEASWSGREQSAMDTATDESRAALREANLAYEERFGHVFLIFATGRTDTEMLAEARSRLGNDEQTERDVVRTELGRIVALRLTGLLDSLGSARA